MENKEAEIRVLKLKEKQKEVEIKIAQEELMKLRKEVFELEYPVMKWDDLEQWLRENRPKNNYTENPIVSRLNNEHYKSYCKLNEKGELEIGGYWNKDGYPRGRDLRVHYKFKPYR